MEQNTEIWIVTTLSILAACFIGVLLRRLLYLLLQRVIMGEKSQDVLIYSSQAIHAIISTFMLIVGTYEKCLLIASGMVFEYYLSTLVLTVIYRYVLTMSSPNPLPVIITNWNEIYEESASLENEDVEALPASPKRRAGGRMRRRGFESSSENVLKATDKKVDTSSNKVLTCLKKSAPSLFGLYLGLYTAIQWLHFAWDGYLTSVHTSKTGLLQDCIIVLQTGPVQGILVEAFVTFFYQFVTTKLKDVRVGNPGQSYFVSSILFSIITTTTLYTFINVTGSFANPLLAYALERECLYDFTSIINHVLVYWAGALCGAIGYYVLPSSKHLSVIGAGSLLFSFVYFFAPSVVEKSYVFY